MASTRNINKQAEYCVEQRKNTGVLGYQSYMHSQHGNSRNTAIPNAGINMGSLPREHLSYNPVDIESNLRGIGASNLVGGVFKVAPALKELPSVKFFDRTEVFVPEPLVVEGNQRPEWK
jgi:hypothetical protein